MTQMPNAFDFELAAKLPRYDIKLELQVADGNTWLTIHKLYGSIRQRDRLRKRLERQLNSWRASLHFGDALLRIDEHRGGFIAT